MELTKHSRYPFTIDYGYINFKKKDDLPFSCRGPKLYVISVSGRPIYVGTTTKPIKKRLSDGIKPSSSSRYLWSHWNHFPLEELAVDVWAVNVDDKDIETMKDDPNMKLAIDGIVNKSPKDIILETVEAEVAFLIRRDTDKWPKYQIEIHFHQSQDTHREIAEEIVSHYRSP